MSLILTHSEGDSVFIHHQIQIPHGRIDELIARLQQAKVKKQDIILPSEKIEIFFQFIRVNGQLRVGYNGPTTFNIVRGKIKDTRNLEPPVGGIAG